MANNKQEELKPIQAPQDTAVKTLVIDTVDRAYPLCVDFVCKRLGISHPSEMEFGKGWGAVRTEWERVIQKLNLLGYALVLTAHETDKKIKTKKIEIDVKYPDLPKTGLDIVTDLADVVAHYSFREDDSRGLFCCPSTERYAKWRGPRGVVPPDCIPVTNDGKTFQRFDETLKKLNGKTYAESRPTVVIYGTAGVGKSTLASEFPNATFADFENGLKWLDIKNKTVVSNWEDFLGFCGKLSNGGK